MPRGRWIVLTGDWQLTRHAAPAGRLHEESAEALAQGGPRMARILEADGPAMVLGSHQTDRHFDPAALAAAGVALARRRSGGASVLVGPGLVAWVDLVLTPGDPLWHDDIGRAAWWVGELWASALAEAGLAAEVWTGPMRSSPWSDVVCFAGRGPGEVTVADRKVVGISQRRTARGALFQTALMVRWEPERYLGLMTAEVRDRPLDGLHEAAEGVGQDVADVALSALVSRLMT